MLEATQEVPLAGLASPRCFPLSVEGEAWRSGFAGPPNRALLSVGFNCWEEDGL